MKVAIMQPYFFPYLGYFQLINAVDKFVIYDDVTYIKQGWINRNNILVSGESFQFSIPLEKSSSFKKINDTILHPRLYSIWRFKFLKTLTHAYLKAPYFLVGYKLIEKVLFEEYENISQLNAGAITEVCKLLNIKTHIVTSSTVYKNDFLKGDQRIFDICKKESASVYINPIGGKSLYCKKSFAEKGFELLFLKSNALSYYQNQNYFIPNLSIIDLIMYVHNDQLGNYFKQYTLE
jgi:hypothetical protein